MKSIFLILLDINVVRDFLIFNQVIIITSICFIIKLYITNLLLLQYYKIIYQFNK